MVTCHTIESLLRDYGPEGLSTSIDYLSIDTEGSEQEIIDAIDFGQVNVSGVVQVEANLGEILQLRDAKAIKKVQAIRDRMLNFDFHGQHQTLIDDQIDSKKIKKVSINKWYIDDFHLL